MSKQPGVQLMKALVETLVEQALANLDLQGRCCLENAQGNLDSLVGWTQAYYGDSLIIVEVVAEFGALSATLSLSVEGGDYLGLLKEVLEATSSIPESEWEPVPRPIGIRVHAHAPRRVLRHPCGLPEQSRPDHAHYVLHQELSDGLAHGRALRALCGHVWIATETGNELAERYEVCPICSLVRYIVTLLG